MRGGPSHIDMWDPKPDAPAEYRGEFGTIPTNVPGILLCDMLPLSARIMDKWSIVRSLHHHDAGHSTGDQICFTGYNAGPNPDENVHPSCGSIVSKQLGHTDAAPAGLRDDPADGARHRAGLPRRGAQAVRDAGRPGRSPARSGCRTSRCRRASRSSGSATARDCCDRFDALRRDVDATGQIDAARPLQQKAWDILTSPAARDAFDLDTRAEVGPRALRLHAGVRPEGGQPLRLPGLEPAHPAGPPAGRGRRAAGDGRPALVGHAREGLRVAAARLPAALGPGVLGADRGPGGPRPAGDRRWCSPGASSAARRG